MGNESQPVQPVGQPQAEQPQAGQPQAGQPQAGQPQVTPEPNEIVVDTPAAENQDTKASEQTATEQTEKNKEETQAQEEAKKEEEKKTQAEEEAQKEEKKEAQTEEEAKKKEEEKKKKEKEAEENRRKAELKDLQQSTAHNTQANNTAKAKPQPSGGKTSTAGLGSNSASTPSKPNINLNVKSNFTAAALGITGMALGAVCLAAGLVFPPLLMLGGALFLGGAAVTGLAAFSQGLSVLAGGLSLIKHAVTSTFSNSGDKAAAEHSHNLSPAIEGENLGASQRSNSEPPKPQPTGSKTLDQVIGEYEAIKAKYQKCYNGHHNELNQEANKILDEISTIGATLTALKSKGADSVQQNMLEDLSNKLGIHDANLQMTLSSKETIYSATAAYARMKEKEFTAEAQAQAATEATTPATPSGPKR